MAESWKMEAGVDFVVWIFTGVIVHMKNLEVLCLQQQCWLQAVCCEKDEGGEIESQNC